MFSSDFHGKTPEKPLRFRYRCCNLLREDISGNVPVKKLFPRSRYCS
uniref:Uncharacterized protein n=1 Tax=Rhizophora mucronata TaxID=61149 RepID=A0A2P2IYN0_RHIMU